MKTEGESFRTEAVDIIGRFMYHLNEGCIGTVSEIFDGDAPHHPRGCVAQAWGVAEILWLQRRHVFIASRIQERFYFGDNAAPLFESGIPLLKKQLAKLPDADNITIAYPDEGAWKRFKYQFSDYPEVCRGQGCGRCAWADVAGRCWPEPQFCLC